MKFDLHLHTTASDGTDSPEELVMLAAHSGFQLIAVTDHDTLSGIPEAVEAGKKLGVRVIPGVEISTGGEKEVHVLGYAMRDADQLKHTLFEMRARREMRMRKMIHRLNEINVPVRLEQVTQLAHGSVGRAHLARVLVDLGVVRDVREAFARYLSPGRPAYVEREKLGTAQAVKLIKDAGGIPVIAHPGQNREDNFWMKERFEELKRAGLMGIEAYHMAHDQQKAYAFDRVARQLGLLVTGGSDYHGKVKNVAMGDGMQYWKTKEEDIQCFLQAIRGMEGL